MTVVYKYWEVKFLQDVSLHWLYFISKVKQVSSAIFCQENDEHTHSMLQSLGLDNLTIQAFGFSILVLYFAYVIFSPLKRKNFGIEREPSLKNFDTQPTEAALMSPGELNCCFNALTLMTWFVLLIIHSNLFCGNPRLTPCHHLTTTTRIHFRC